MDGSRVTFLHLVRSTRVHRSMTVVEIVHLLATRFRPGHAFFAALAGASNPEFLCPTLRVVKLRPHVMNLVVETDNLVDGQPQRPKSLQKEASDSFDNMLLSTSRIMRAAREKLRERRNDPVSLHQSQLCRCLGRQKHVGLLCHRKCLMRARDRVFCGLFVQCPKAIA